MEHTLTLALAQMDVIVGDWGANLRQATAAAAQAARRGAALLLLPELWAYGYAPAHFAAWAHPLGEGVFAHMAALAKSYRLAVGGSHLERAPEGIYNTFALYGPQGQLWGAYRKIHRFLPMGEGRLRAGERVCVADTPWGKVGLAVCYDLRFPEIFRLQAFAGARVLLLVAQWPQSRIAHWEALLRARAIENQAFVAAANRVGAQERTVFGGQSAVLSPRGEVVALAGAQETLLIATIDLQAADHYRREFPALQHAVPSAYRLEEAEDGI